MRELLLGPTKLQSHVKPMLSAANIFFPSLKIAKPTKAAVYGPTTASHAFLWHQPSFQLNGSAGPFQCPDVSAGNSTAPLPPLSQSPCFSPVAHKPSEGLSGSEPPPMRTGLETINSNAAVKKSCTDQTDLA